MITDFPWNLYSIYMYASQRYRQALTKENSELGWHFFFTYPWLILSLSLSRYAREMKPRHEKISLWHHFSYTQGGEKLTLYSWAKTPPPTLISVPNIYIYFYYYLNSWPHKEKREKKREKKNFIQLILIAQAPRWRPTPFFLYFYTFYPITCFSLCLTPFPSHTQEI